MRGTAVSRVCSSSLMAVAGAVVATMMLGVSSAQAGEVPSPTPWERKLQQDPHSYPYTDITCIVADVPHAPDSVYFEQGGWGRYLKAGHEWFVVVVLTRGTETEMSFIGYGSDLTYSTPGQDPIDGIVICQGRPDLQHGMPTAVEPAAVAVGGERPPGPGLGPALLGGLATAGLGAGAVCAVATVLRRGSAPGPSKASQRPSPA